MRSVDHQARCGTAEHAPVTSTDGSFSWVVFLTFDDGVEWVFRSPHDDGAVRSTETSSTLLASEAVTLKYIKTHSAIPVPEVYAYGYLYIAPLSTRHVYDDDDDHEYHKASDHWNNFV